MGENKAQQSLGSLKLELIPKKSHWEKAFSLVNGTSGVAFCFAVLYRERKTTEEVELV